MRIATPEDFAKVRAMIERQTTERIERTITGAQTFAASPAYEKALVEIVAKGRKLGVTD